MLKHFPVSGVGRIYVQHELIHHSHEGSPITQVIRCQYITVDLDIREALAGIHVIRLNTYLTNFPKVVLRVLFAALIVSTSLWLKYFML